MLLRKGGKENLNCFIGRRMGRPLFPSQEFHFHVQGLMFEKDNDAAAVLPLVEI